MGLEDALEKEMATSPVLLPGKSHGQRSLAGCSLWSHKETDTSQQLNNNKGFHNMLSAVSHGELESIN